MNNELNNTFDTVSPRLSISAIKRIARSRLRGHWSKAFLPCLIITILTAGPALFSSITSTSAMMSIMTDESFMNSDDPMAMYNALANVNPGGAASVLSSMLSLFTFLCAGALSVSMAILCLRIIRQEEYGPGIAFSGFRQFGQAFLVSLLIAVFTFLWALVTVVPGIIVFSVGIAMDNSIMAILGTIIFITTIVGYILIVLRYEMSYFVASDNRMMPATHVTADSVYMMKRRTGNYFLLQLSFIGWAILASIPLIIGLQMIFINSFNGGGSGLLPVIGSVISVLGLLPITIVQLYITTSNAVYYSTISGQYNVNAPSDPTGGSPSGYGAPAADDDPSLPEGFGTSSLPSGSTAEVPASDDALNSSADPMENISSATDVPAGGGFTAAEASANSPEEKPEWSVWTPSSSEDSDPEE